MNEQAPARTVVLAMQASGALEYYTDAVVARWDQLEPESFNLLRDRFEARGYAVYALLFPFESERFQQNILGRWEVVEDYPPMTLLRLQPDERGTAMFTSSTTPVSTSTCNSLSVPSGLSWVH